MKVEQLEKLLSEATPAPWRIPGKGVKHESISQWGQIVHGDRTLFQYNYNFDGTVDKKLVCALRNAAPALLAVVKAAKAYQNERIEIAKASSYWQKSPAEIEMDDALKALDEVK